MPKGWCLSADVEILASLGAVGRGEGDEAASVSVLTCRVQGLDRPACALCPFASPPRTTSSLGSFPFIHSANIWCWALCAPHPAWPAETEISRWLQTRGFMTCRLRPEGAEAAGQGSEWEDVSGVESIPQGPGSEGASGGHVLLGLRVLLFSPPQTRIGCG